MSEQLTWVQWWVTPWVNAHPDWDITDKYKASTVLSHSHHRAISQALDITPCLPQAPTPALARLVFASAEQLELMLTLIEDVCRPKAQELADTDQYLWCQRLSRALHSDALLCAGEDPLHLLRQWVAPTVWQRLRVRFSRQRVLRLSASYPLNMQGRLDTVLQAIIWRAWANNN